MNKINNIIRKAALSCLGMMALSSCTDSNDWSVDSAFDRLFGTTDITVTPSDVTAQITFTKRSGATGYVVEVNTDSTTLYSSDDVNASSLVDTVASTPATISGLSGETVYYLRMKCIGEGKNDSHWVYYESGSGKNYFTTKAEQIFNSLGSSDVTENSVRLTWDATKTVTNIIVKSGDEEVQNIELSDADKAAGEYTVTGLNPTTTYSVVIMNGDAKRGTLTATTAAAMPGADYKYYLPSSVTVIDQDIIDQIATEAQAAAGSSTNYSVTIGIKAGANVNVQGTSDSGEPANVSIPDGMSVTFFGLAGGDAPTLNFTKSFDIKGSHAYIRFQNVKLVDGGASYFINQSATSTVDEFTISDSEASGFKNAFFRLQGSNGITVNKLNLDNSIFHDMCSGYSFIHVDAGSGKGKVNNINITNSTFYSIAASGKMFIYSKNTNIESISLDHVTMYNCVGNNNYFVDFGAATYGASSFTISNSIFAKTPDEATKNIRASVLPTYSNSYTLSDFFKTFKGCGSVDASSADVFTAPESGNFTLKDKYISLGAGDSRWIVSE